MRIVLREFQRHMHQYLAGECEVYGTKGNFLGKWTPSTVKEVDPELDIEDENEEIV